VTCVRARPGRSGASPGAPAARRLLRGAIAAGAQAFLTGEISEPQAHYAREMRRGFLACGHHATERYGAPAVAAHVARQLGLEHEFIDDRQPGMKQRSPSRIGDPAGIGPRSSPRLSRGAELTRGCFVAGDLACLRRGARRPRAACRAGAR
jgi:hypothetical protein